VALADSSRARLAPEQTPAAAIDSLDTKRLADAAPAAAAPPALMKGYISKQDKVAETEAANAAAPGGQASAGRAASASMARREAAAASSEHRLEADATLAGGGQRFASQNNTQAFRNNSQGRQTANILNNFQVEQQGNEIRVVDADGSTYTGQLESTSQFGDRGAARAKRSYAAPATAAEAKPEPVQSRFRATGYNVSLKKPLVFEGNYTQAAGSEQTNSNDRSQSPEKQGVPRIVGTAQVNGQPTVQVDATEVEPTPAKQK
jgi:hypothetical protein